MKTSTSDVELLAEFAWSCWAEFGVSTWARHHTDWCHDPEALLVLTGCLGRTDPRLRGEVLDWASVAKGLLSRTRARNILKSWPQPEAWPAFAADLSAATGMPWPGATGDGTFVRSGKSELHLSDRPAALSLRARAILGVGARSEIIRILACATSEAVWTTRLLAEESAYMRRNVYDSVEPLVRAGVLRTRSHDPRSPLQLADQELWRKVLAPVPSRSGSSLAACRAAWRIHRMRAEVLSKPAELRSLVARKAWNPIHDDLVDGGWTPPRDKPGTDAWAAYGDWTKDFLINLARGH